MKSTSLALLAASVLAIAFNPAGSARADDAPKADAPPIPTLQCKIGKVSSCSPDGACKAEENFGGVKLPLMITVDFENGIVAAVDDTGFARTDKMDAVAKTADQLVLHGVDGEFGWQLLISDKTEVASLTMSTADMAVVGFGTCANK